jgi:tetratricopeptide (TPR) repeat protein/cellulose biosynthesis protein BcsQ
MGSQDQIITFYSYKGGTGRTMAVANVGCLLAEQTASDNKGVLLIDWDLEAPGLHRFFRNRLRLPSTSAESYDESVDEQLGLIDLMVDLKMAVETKASRIGQILNDSQAKDLLDSIDIDAYCLRTEIRGLSLLKAGRMDAAYASKVNSFDWVGMYDKCPSLFRLFAEQLTSKFRFVVIDSRTGISDASGVCTSLLPEKLVVAFTPNRQSLTGCISLVRSATRYRRASEDIRPLAVFPLISRVVDSQQSLIAKWRFGDEASGLDGYQPMFERLFKEVYDLPECDLKEHFDEVQIQHTADYAFGEDIAVLDEPLADRLSLTRSYRTFTDRLVRLDGPWDTANAGPDFGAINTLNVAPRNPNFTGRGEILAALQADRMTYGRRCALQTLAGLGGIGKTQIAVEYAYRHKDDYDIIWWLRAEREETLGADLADLAVTLGLAEKASDHEANVRASLDFLGKFDRWLLIYDNAESSDAVRNLLPKGNGHVLITTRNPVSDGSTFVVEIDTWPRHDSVEFLTRRLRLGEDAETNIVANLGALAEDLGDLPLAMEQAAAYIDQTGLSVAKFRQRFKGYQTRIFDRDPPRGYQATVTTTWSMVLDEASKTPYAADLLYLCAYMAPDNIPVSLLAQWSHASDALARDRAMAVLRAYSLVQVNQSESDASDDLLSVHRLVQAVIRDQLVSAGRADEYLGEAIKLIDQAFPKKSDEASTWPECERLSSHGLAIFDHLEERPDLALGEAASILGRLGNFRTCQGLYREAEPLLVRALEMNRIVHGDDHVDTAASLHYLGYLYRCQWQYAKANSHYERALVIRERKPDDPATAKTLDHLGGSYFFSGRYDEADRLLSRSLAIREKAFGPEHLETATSLNILGWLHIDQGRYAEAHAELERALEIREKALGRNHPVTARTQHNLAKLLAAEGRYDDAEPLFVHALAIHEKTFGADHVICCVDRIGMGRLRQLQGRVAEAKELYTSVLTRGGKSISADNPILAVCTRRYASLLREQGSALLASLPGGATALSASEGAEGV